MKISFDMNELGDATSEFAGKPFSATFKDDIVTLWHYSQHNGKYSAIYFNKKSKDLRILDHYTLNKDGWKILIELGKGVDSHGVMIFDDLLEAMAWLIKDEWENE